VQKQSRAMVAALAAALVVPPAGFALAQGAPSGGTAPAATSTAAPETKAPENKSPENTGPEKTKAAAKKKKPVKMTRQQEIDRSVERGTVPALSELGAERVSSVYSVR
jgi:hypothetical protein